MKIVFVSSYFNHHQKPLSDELFRLTNGEYRFIETKQMNDERRSLGYGETIIPSYVLPPELAFTEKAQDLIDHADAVIFGGAPDALIQNRLLAEKLTFRYSERIYKRHTPYWKLPVHFLKFHKLHRRHKSLYMLCASAYTAGDYAKSLTFLNRTYKWGYFPEVKVYENIDTLIREKKQNSILWCGRFIDWKHPEIPLEIAKRLKKDGYDFEINMIGNGVLLDEITERIAAENLSDTVHPLGSMKPQEVRAYMEKSELFLFTSDRNEGWGAVLNESMNSACAVVVDRNIGAAPFLIREGENGLLYKTGDIDCIYKHVTELLDHPERRKQLSKNAYLTMREEWNAENAARRFLQLAETLRSSKSTDSPFECDVCSKAEIISNGWYKK